MSTPDKEKGKNNIEPYSLDREKVQAAFSRAAKTYDEAAVLQHEIGNRMM